MRYALILALMLAGCSAQPPTVPETLPYSFGGNPDTGIAQAQGLWSVRLVRLTPTSATVHADGPAAGPIVWEVLECPGYDALYRGPGPLPPDAHCPRVLPLVQADGRTALIRRQTRALYKIRVKGALYGFWSPYLDVLPGMAQ